MKKVRGFIDSRVWCKRLALCSCLSLISYLVVAQCPDGEIPDCNGNCYPADWIGDGVCDDGYNFPSDFMCTEFGWDNNDCGCNQGKLMDCNGICQDISLIGDGFCHNDEAVNFACELYNWDDGDCEVVCGEGQFADCDGNCWDNEILIYLSNWHCNNTFWLESSGSSVFYNGPTELNLDCEMFDFDGGDCLVQACTDPTAMNYYEHATIDDGSCFYGDCPPGTMDCMGNCIPDNWLGNNECGDGLSSNPEPYLFNGAYPNFLSTNVPLPANSPRGMCVLPDGSKAFIGTDQGIVITDLNDTGECVSSTLIPTDGLIHSCSSSVDGQYVFAANRSLGQVEVVDVASQTIIQSIPAGNSTVKMWTSNDGLRVYASNENSNTVTVIDALSFNVITNLNVGLNPRNICTSPDDSRLYISNWGDWSMQVINTDTWETIAVVPVDYWPQAIWAMPNDDYVLVANFGFDFTYDHISVIRVSDWEVIARLQTGAGPEDMLSIGPNGEYLYVSNWGMPCCFFTSSDLCCSTEIDKGSVTVIATPDFDTLVPEGTIPDPIPYIQSTLKIIPLESVYSFGMAKHPDENEIYIVNKDSNSMSVVGFEEANLPEEQEGETCQNAIPLLSLEFCIDNCTNAYEDNYNEMCPFEETGGPDLVYHYQATSTETVNLDLCESSYDTKIYIYEGSCGIYNSGTAIYCNDDFCGVNGWRSRLENVQFEAGLDYYIVVDGWGANDRGSFQICFENDCPGDLNNDGVVNLLDLLQFLIYFNAQFDVQDLLFFLLEFGVSCE